METADQNREGTPLLKRADVILALGLEPHVEGGAYRRVYESAVRLPSGERSASAIYYLLGAEELPRLEAGRELLVTPKDIDSQVSDLARVIGYGINLALQPELTLEELELLLG